VPQTDGKQYAPYHDFPCVSQAAVPQTDAKRYITYKHVFIPRETHNFASHKQSFHTLTRYNIPHISMFSSLGRRKILRLYKADATNKTVIKPSRDAKFCVSQTNVPQTDGKQYATYNDFPCVSQAAVSQTDAKLYITYKYAFTPRETQNLASLQG